MFSVYEIVNNYNSLNYIGYTSKPLETVIPTKIYFASKKSENERQSIENDLLKRGKQNFSIHLIKANIEDVNDAIRTKNILIKKRKPYYNEQDRKYIYD